MRASSPDLAGALTESNLETLCADIAFIGAQGIDRKGTVYQQSPEIASLLSKMAKAANHLFVVADGSKLDKTALCRCGSIQNWDGLITDKSADPREVAGLRKKGVKVFIA